MDITLAASAFDRYGGLSWSNTGGLNTIFRVNDTEAIGQAVLANFHAPGGRYDIKFHLLKEPNGAIIDVNLDGVVIGTYDLYAAAGMVVTPTINNILLSDGDHYMKVTITGKNGASSSYVCYFGFVAITSH